MSDSFSNRMSDADNDRDLPPAAYEEPAAFDPVSDALISLFDFVYNERELYVQFQQRMLERDGTSENRTLHEWQELFTEFWQSKYGEDGPDE